MTSISELARTSPGVCKMLLTMVQGLAESSRGDISKPAEVTLTLVSFAQATPLILATRFALSWCAVAKIKGLGLELHRLAAGISSMAQVGVQLKYARLLSPHGASLLGSKCFTTLAHLGRHIDSPRWGQVKLPALASNSLLETGKRVYTTSSPAFLSRLHSQVRVAPTAMLKRARENQRALERSRVVACSP